MSDPKPYDIDDDHPSVAQDTIAELERRLALALSVKVQFVDNEAAARVTPQQAEAYLKRTGWERTVDNIGWSAWSLLNDYAEVPARPEFMYYPRCMGDLVRTLADVEKRSPIAVLIDLLAEAP